ncbi:g-specific adenine glycosylase [Fusarium longipes]|uniref:Adenine DNA glycosylase n=1 Tax=Fusarium longipes TaxID=694270 RepID=A0A395SEB8_9HYPO|nr:g-specific adenine glycosylase [Fusarium longipes]
MDKFLIKVPPRTTRSSAASASQKISSQLEHDDELTIPVRKRASKRPSPHQDADFDASASEEDAVPEDDTEQPTAKKRKTQPSRSKAEILKIQDSLFSSKGETDSNPCTPPSRQHHITYHRPLLLKESSSRQALLEWFDGVSTKRSMPWRKAWINPKDHGQDELRDLLERRAYGVWISEIMLQQTRVAVVIDYWNRWMDKWPTIHDLAAASADDVLSAWRGLGYYSRATRIHEAAKLVVNDSTMKGLLPSNAQDLEAKVPGVGRYTAGAISSIVFGRAAPMVDGNVLRVLSRQLGLFGNVKTNKAVIDTLWAAADALVKAIARDGTDKQEGEEAETSDRPGRWGQALMELGSTICIPKPNCSECPITSTCRVYAEGKTLVSSKDRGTKIGDIEDICDLCEPFEEAAPDETEVKVEDTKASKGATTKGAQGKQMTLSAFAFKASTEDKPSTTKTKATLSPRDIETVVEHARKFPLKVIKKAVREEDTLVCVVRRADGEYLIQKRPEKGLLAGLWEFPSYILQDAKEGNTPAKRRSKALAYVSKIADEHGGKAAKAKHVAELGSVPWLFSHLKLTMHVHLFTLEDGDLNDTKSLTRDRLRWATSEAVDAESMGTGMRRPALFDAITSACDLIDQQIASDLEKTKQELNEALQQRDDHASRIARLADENARLREQLQQKLSTKHARNTSPVSSLSENANEPDWKLECSKVSQKFKALSANFKQAKDALRKRKEERDRWVNHATLLEKKIKAAEEEHGINITERHNRNTRATTLPAARVTEENVPSPSTSFTSEAGLDQADLDLPPLAAASLHDNNLPLPDTRTAHPSSDSTESEVESKRDDNELPELPPQNDVKIKEEPSSDPIVISEREVRKRKRDNEDNEMPLQRVKLEEDERSSSPIHPLGPATLVPHESLDLGDVAQRLLTPRKRRELEESQWQERVKSEAFATATTTPRTLFVRPDPPQTARPIERTSALTPLSVNRRVVRPGKENPTTPLKVLDRGISTLAEDGEAYRQNSGPNVAPKGRLDTLLNSPAVQNDTPTVRLNPRAAARPSTTAEDLAIPGRRILPFEGAVRAKNRPPVQQMLTPSRTPTIAAASKITPQNARSPLASKQGAQSRLRHKPLSQLRPDDFKINPQANDGHDFAFSDVVRNKDERSRMQGCTEMHCCGENYRKLAISQRPNSPLTAAERQEEQKLLEEYLGDFAYKLGTMDKKERDELWIEAKAQQLSNKHNPHRYQYARMRSPPGFWNADFPNTQELEEERSEAAQREKQTVRDRHREAMRPGGRWLFRDE